MKNWAELLLSLLLVAAADSPAAAQEGGPAAGMRVRVHHRVNTVRPFTGAYVGSTRDSLYLVPDGSDSPEPIALADIRRLQRSAGQQSNLWRGAMIGAIVGAVAGVGVGIAEPVLEDGAEESALIPVATGAIGALAGGVVGGLIGSLSRSERWEPMVWADAGARTGRLRLGDPGSSGSRIGLGIRVGLGGRVAGPDEGA
jgi:hypothetical protein